VGTNFFGFVTRLTDGETDRQLSRG